MSIDRRGGAEKGEPNRHRTELRVRARRSAKYAVYFGVGMGLAYLSTWPWGIAEPGQVSVLKALIMGVLNGLLMWCMLIYVTPRLPVWMQVRKVEDEIVDELEVLDALQRKDPTNRSDS